MKKLFYLLVFLLVVQSSGAQKIPTDFVEPDLLKKSKKQRTAAFVLLGAGALTAIVGFSISAGHLFTDLIEGRKQVRGTGAMVAGGAIMAGSIPFFTMSRQNRRAGLTASGITIVLPQSKHFASSRSFNGVQITLFQTLF